MSSLKWKKVALCIRDVIEIYIPLVAFILLVASFTLQIFFRYAMNRPLIWTQEVILSCFVWTVLLGACYARRSQSHIRFSMFYDHLSEKGRLVSRLAGNGLIVLLFIPIILPSADYIQFMSSEMTPFFRIKFSYVFFPFNIFLLLMIGYSVFDISKDIRLLISRR